jgi:hypothetical protein
MNSFTYPQFHTRSHRKHRLLKLPSLQGTIPNGYLEDCTHPDPVPISVPVSDPSKSISSQPTERKELVPSVPLSQPVFQPVSLSLKTLEDFILNADNNYTIKFNTGMVEGTGIAITDGNHIVFENAGSYHFEILGTAVPYTSVGLTLVYGDVPDDIKIFSEVPLPKDDGAVRLELGRTTIPVDKDQRISLRIVPDQPETITLSAGCRLFVFRVA